MTTYPLPTLAAQVTSTGIAAPSYADILASLKASYHQIFGADAYIEDDSQDGQLLGVFAQAINDCNTTCIAVYNSFSPATAIGAALASNVKINGLAKLISSNSTVDVTISGVAGTTITNGVVEDTNGNKWDLPASVVIPNSGAIVVTATCETQGAINIGAGLVTKIATPTLNWQSVTNASAATPGNPVEADSALRQRQAVSTELPAQSIIGGIYGQLANLTGVQQLKIYDNDTGAADANGIPAHSIAVVINGGDAVAIASAIALKKTPGTGTFGTTSEIIIDSVGVPNTIRFFRPTQVTIDVSISLKALTGYANSTGVAIQTALAAAISAMGINANNGLLSLTELYAVIYGVANANTFNITNLKISKDPAVPAAADLAIAFNELPVCVIANITIAVS